MKSTNSDHPRFACRFVRILSSFKAGPADGDDRISRHIETCESCREYFQAGEALDLHLRRDARSRMQQVPGGLEDRIFDSVDLVDRSTKPATLGTPVMLYSLAGAAAMFAVALFLLRGPTTTPDIAQNQTPAVEDSSGMFASTSIAAIDAVPRGMRNLVDSSSTTLREQNPLQHEADAVYSDTRSALRFLALNFLPRVPDALSAQTVAPTS